MNFKIKLFLFLFLLGFFQTSYSQVFEWAKSVTGHGLSGRGFVGAVDICVGKNESSYTTGEFNWVKDFDPGPGVFNLTANPLLSNGYVLKLDSAGNFVWAKHLKGYCTTISMAIDSIDNLYITGTFYQTVDFDPSSNVHNRTSSINSNANMFVLKLDSNGLFRWVKTFEGRIIQPRELKLDKQGNIIVVGYFGHTADFDPGVNVRNFTSNGRGDFFILKLNSVGDYNWCKTLGSPMEDQAMSTAIDEDGSIYTTGWFSDSLDFNPGTGVFKLPVNTVRTGVVNEMFLLKLDSVGRFVWATSTYSLSQAAVIYPVAISVCNNSSIVVFGDFLGAIDVDPTLNVSSLISRNSSRDIFVSKYDLSGNLIWAKSMGGANSLEIASEMRLDSSWNILTTGTYTGVADFDPGQSIFNLYPHSQSTGINNALFLQKMDSNGVFRWAKSVVARISIRATGLDIKANNVIHLAGGHRDSADFDPGIGNFFTSPPNPAYTNAFILKLDDCSETVIDTIVACNSYKWIDGITYRSNNTTAKFTLLNARGCDSIITLNLTINRTMNRTQTISACDSLKWINGVTYFQNTIGPSMKFVNSFGCDSNVVLRLTIKKSIHFKDSIMSCKPVTWINGKTYTTSNYSDKVTLVNSSGCDSVIWLQLTIDGATFYTDSISSCKPVTWINGLSYTSSNNSAKDTLINSNGCDSIVSLSFKLLSNTQSTDSQKSCDEFKWLNGITYVENNQSATFTLLNSVGCDSNVSLNLTINKSTEFVQQISACNPYSWIDGNSYLNDNSTAKHSIMNSKGCDSLVYLDLKIVTADVSVEKTGSTLYANTNSQHFQWIDCNTNSIVENATEKTFKPDETGTYAVQIVENGCEKTSECVTINKLCSLKLKASPNPTWQTDVRLELIDLCGKYNLSVFNVLGQLISKKNDNESETVQLYLPIDFGEYYIRVVTEFGETATIKILKGDHQDSGF